MTQQLIEIEQSRGRGPARQFPVVNFEDALVLPKGILEHGLDGEINRLTLFSKLNKAPDSGPSTVLLSAARKYNLASGGSSKSPSLSITDAGRTAVDDQRSLRDSIAERFRLAIGQFDCFNSLYEKSKNRRLPDVAVMSDELGKFGVSANDRQKATDVFTANLRFLGLIQDIAGSEHVRAVEEVLSEMPEDGQTYDGTGIDDSAVQATPFSNVRESNGLTTAADGPALHVDLQIHIDASASPEQIEHIFVSMARYLYGREV